MTIPCACVKLALDRLRGSEQRSLLTSVANVARVSKSHRQKQPTSGLGLLATSAFSVTVLGFACSFLEDENVDEKARRKTQHQSRLTDEQDGSAADISKWDVLFRDHVNIERYWPGYDLWNVPSLFRSQMSNLVFSTTLAVVMEQEEKSNKYIATNPAQAASHISPISLQLRQAASTEHTLESKYRVHWRRPLGEGAFGAVYLGTNRQTGEKVAIKKISQRFTDRWSFQNEMGALLQIRQAGGHPNICGMKENFVELSDDEDGYFYLVLDLIAGGEMFDQLCNAGPYSEADAARLIREVASALNFLHGIGITHADLKPENLMLSSKESAKAVIKLVDFGCARSDAVLEALRLQQIETQGSNGSKGDVDVHETAITPAYTPPEMFNRSRAPLAEDSVNRHLEPSFDMWAVGVILYIMLTGVHPFDLNGSSTDEEIEEAVLSGKKPPLGSSPLTAHLSPDAIKLIDQLLQWNPKRRLTAHELLEHPWVRGETARTQKIANSDKRLSAYRAYKTKLEAKVFADMISASAGQSDSNIESPALGASEVSKKMSLIEIAFLRFDPDNSGFITAKELRKLVGDSGAAQIPNDERLSMSCFSDILASNMKNRYFPKGHLIYKQGDIGNSMFFLNSGSVEEFTKEGYRSLRNAGEFFGEDALLNQKRTHSSSVRAITPIHLLEIERDYFEKYMASDSDVKLKLQEKDKARKRERAKSLLQLQANTTEKTIFKGDFFFKRGERSNDLFVLSEGEVWLVAGDQKVVKVDIGQFCGEHSSIFARPRNVDARCESDQCKAFVVSARDFQKLLSKQPHFNESIREICLHREFKKAFCFETRQQFPKEEKELRAAFAYIAGKSGDPAYIELDDVRSMLSNFDPTYTERDIVEVLESLDLDRSGKMAWWEFKRLFESENTTVKEKPKGREWRRKKWKRSL